MRIAVFGATGKTGIEIVQAAIDKKIKVNAFSRSSILPEILVKSDVKIFQGTLDSIEDINKVNHSCGAIVISLGPRPPYSDIFCENATKLIIQSAEMNNINRIICITGAAVGRDLKNCSWIFRIIARMLYKNNPKLAEDRIKQDEVIGNSRLNWTIVKPPRLTLGKAFNNLKVGEDVFIGLMSRIARKSLARFVIEEILNIKYSQKRVFLKQC